MREATLLDILHGCRVSHSRAVRMARGFRYGVREIFMKDARQDRLHARHTIQRIRALRKGDNHVSA